jgi:uncharacterized protein (TIGR02266 family)
MSHQKKIRRWPRFVTYLPVECTVLAPGQSSHKHLHGTTLNVGAGGLALLLSETLRLGIPVMLSVSQHGPLRGSIVWIDRRLRTLLGPSVPHGVAFDQPVDSALIRRWVSESRKRVHARAPVEFDVEYRVGGRAARGRCLNLSQGGMFIASDHPVAPGTEVTLRFALLDLSQPLSVRSRVAWASGQEVGPDPITGMGVQFLDLSPLDAAVIGTLVDRMHAEASAADSSCLPLPR